MVRQAEMSDHPRLAALFRQLHAHHVRINPGSFRMPGEEWFAERIEALLSDGEAVVFVHVGDGGALEGYAAVKIMTVDPPERVPRKMCYIDCFAVAEDRRRSGVGTALLRRVEDYARENACGSVQLGVNAANGDAIRFYEKMGLTPRSIQLEKRL
ncbi:MAG: GNAT family N-acetyltransferase [Bacteroides sp.]|nr:GNAT family N-acetyltransferase [Eubacterium sp.]MCM1419030.1 GNAT family N-acetyltransferase [Roseburia sp.]MCM1463551.1 GNAT family N-acetyltransferase [Bacteroides sp.]